MPFSNRKLVHQAWRSRRSGKHGSGRDLDFLEGHVTTASLCLFSSYPNHTASSGQIFSQVFHISKRLHHDLAGVTVRRGRLKTSLWSGRMCHSWAMLESTLHIVLLWRRVRRGDPLQGTGRRQRTEQGSESPGQEGPGRRIRVSMPEGIRHVIIVQRWEAIP